MSFRDVKNSAVEKSELISKRKKTLGTFTSVDCPDNYHQSSSVIINYHQLSFITNYHQLSSMMNYYQLSSIIIN